MHSLCVVLDRKKYKILRYGGFVMESVFTGVLSTSISAGFMVLAVALIRFLFREMPKSFRCFLWILVGVRLLLPFQPESVFGLMPKVEIGRNAALTGQTYQESLVGDMPSGVTPENSGVSGEKEQKRPILSEGEKAGKAGEFASGGKRQLLMKAGAVCWILGVFLWLGYFCFSWYGIKGRLKTAIPETNMGIKIYRSDRILTPFLFGIVHPRIYVPTGLEEECLPYIIRHECAHKERRDYLVKPAAFILLGVHWFNPCIWLAYKLMCRDMELACDELVIREFSVEEKKAYGAALLSCSVSQRKIAACQAFFGESGIKERVKNVFGYKKPAFWAVIFSILICVTVSLCFMTTRREEQEGGAEVSLSRTEILLSQAEIPGSRTEIPESQAEIPSSQTETPGSQAEISKSQAETSGSRTEGAQEETTKTASGQKKAEEADLAENTGTKGQEKGDDATDNSAQKAGETGKEDEAKADLEESEESVKQWIEAFCNRDGKKIFDMYSEEYKKNAGENEIMPTAENEYALGWSSPWPWENSEARIAELTENHAEILYYAWVSDPHVTVWRQSLSYHVEDGKWLVDQADTVMLEHICVLEEFEKAYPGGQINDTPMDYLKNGAGEALNNHALLSSTTYYLPLFKPDTAAVYLLNLLKNEGKVEVTAKADEKGDKAKVSIKFMEGGDEVEVLMVRPYGKEGIWIPQSLEE